MYSDHAVIIRGLNTEDFSIMVLYVNTIFITKLLFWMKHEQMDKLNKAD